MKWNLVAGAVLLTAFAAAPAFAETCVKRDDAVQSLENGHGEMPAGRGVMPNGQLVEIFVNRDSADWTLMFTTPKGVSCMIVKGDSWREILPLVSFSPK